jgi:hypothetical protein
VDAPGKDGYPSVAEEVIQPNPWRKKKMMMRMMIMIMFIFAMVNMNVDHLMDKEIW